MVVWFHVYWLFLVSLSEVLRLEVILSNKRTVKIPYIIQEVKLVHERVLWCLVLLIASLDRQLSLSLGPHQPSLRLFFDYIDLNWFDQSKKENSTRDLRVGSFFGDYFLLVAFYHIDPIHDLVLRVEGECALAWFYVVLILEILVVVNTLNALVLDFLILWRLLKPNRALIHLAYILLVENKHLLLLLS